MPLSYINPYQICSIEVRLISKNNNYEYKEYVPPGRFKKGEIKKGFYATYFPSEGVLNESYFSQFDSVFINGKSIYNFPYITIKTSDDKSHQKIFKSHREMFEYLYKFLIKHPQIDFIGLDEDFKSREVLLEKYQGYPDNLRIIVKKHFPIKTELRY